MTISEDVGKHKNDIGQLDGNSTTATGNYDNFSCNSTNCSAWTIQLVAIQLQHMRLWLQLQLVQHQRVQQLQLLV